MKKIILLAISVLLVCGCVTVDQRSKISDEHRREINQSIQNRMVLENRILDIQQGMIKRGYLNFEEFQEIFNLMKNKDVWGVVKLGYAHTTSAWVETYKNHLIVRPFHSPNFYNLLALSLERNYLPLKAAFYLAIEREDFEGADNIRVSWINALKEISAYFQNYFNYSYDGPCSLEDFCLSRRKNGEWIDWGRFKICPYEKKDSGTVNLVERTNYEITKLTSVVGLTDPMLVTLRKELMTAIKQRKWDDATKIQNLITTRLKELQPEQTQVVYKEGSSIGGQTNVVIQQPSAQHIKVENVPRYGAEDVGRAMRG